MSARRRGIFVSLSIWPECFLRAKNEKKKKEHEGAMTHFRTLKCPSPGQDS